MTKLAASALATAFALVMLGGSAVATLQQGAQAETQQPAATTTYASSPADQMRLGQCRIQYPNLAADRQPSPMECEHAEWIAQRWGGAVLEKTDAGLVERAVYEGRNDFTGVATRDVPRPGWCRAWIAGAAEQPAQSDCRTAERTAALQGGRVLFMPL